MLRKVIGVILGMVVLLFVSLLYEYWWRCSPSGLSMDAAKSIANIKLATQDKKYIVEKFVLQMSEKQSEDWLFRYKANDCTIDIIIDNCGVADIGGMTKGCF